MKLKREYEEDILEEFDSNLTDKDLHKILNHVAFGYTKILKINIQMNL